MRVGIDIVEISRIKKSIQNPRFVERVYSLDEIELCKSKKNPVESFAGRFCAKEAFSKALGTGVRDFSLNEISTLNDDLGCPFIILSGNAKIIAKDYKISVSISHTKEYATAIVILE